jgi:putative ABC transport system permease protein
VTGGWKLALRNLARHRRRNLVTGAAIALGYAGLVLLVGYAIRVERLIRTSSVYLQHRGHLAVYAKGGLVRAQARPSEYALAPGAQERIVAALRDDPRVERVGRFLQGTGLAGNGTQSYPFRALGVELELERWIVTHPDVVGHVSDVLRPRAGRHLADAADAESPVAIATRLQRFLQVGPGDAEPFVQLAGRTHDGSFGATDAQVVGVFQGTSTEDDKSGLVAGLGTLQALYDTDRATYVAAFLRDHREAHAVAREVEARLARAGLAVSVYPFDDRTANPYYAGTMGFLASLVGFIVILVANVVALSVLNAMTLAALERTREMGTFRALGFTRRQLTALFLREAAALTALAIGAGAVAALAVAGAVNLSDLRFEPPGVGGKIQLLITPNLAAFAAPAALLLALSLAATWIAVRRKARTRVSALIAEVAA